MKIHHLRLYCRKLLQVRNFYAKVLGLEVQSESDQHCSFKIGYSLLEFRKHKDARPYHFAINIPTNQIDQAKTWLEERTTLLPFEGDPLIDFSAWDAVAMYFYDPDQNIVEFIARQPLNTEVWGNFGPEMLLGISEIGTPTTDMEKTIQSLAPSGIDKFSGSREVFYAAGDHEGLFIIVDQEKKKWFPVDDPIYPMPFEAQLTIKNKDYNIRYDDEVFTGI
ncbi:MAG: hypothetical protein GYB31_11875 [Bacteroidetes bacterium]|nr:hypothetical protein [Bacteroidota bacterium]